MLISISIILISSNFREPIHWLYLLLEKCFSSFAFTEFIIVKSIVNITSFLSNIFFIASLTAAVSQVFGLLMRGRGNSVWGVAVGVAGTTVWHWIKFSESSFVGVRNWTAWNYLSRFSQFTYVFHWIFTFISHFRLFDGVSVQQWVVFLGCILILILWSYGSINIPILNPWCYRVIHIFILLHGSNWPFSPQVRIILFRCPFTL